MIYILLLLGAKCLENWKYYPKNFGIKILTKTYFCFHCLESINGQLLYRALSQAPSMERKCVISQHHMVTYEINVLEMLTTDRIIHFNSLTICPRIYKFSHFSLLFFWLPIGNFCWNCRRQIYFSLATGTKIVAA